MTRTAGPVRTTAPAAGDDDLAHFLGEREFALACRLIGEYAGIQLSPHKRYMVHNRLSRRLRACGIASFAEYLETVQASPVEREAFVNAMTTNLTAFFREPHHFDLLRQQAEQHRRDSRRALRVWSSACSTGEEAWSIAMTLREAGCPGEIVASDIDTDALESAASGVYPLERMQSLPAERMKAHWLRGVGANAGWASVRPEMRAMATFVPLNLQAPQWPAMDAFDTIFCRNVVIYFDRPAQKRLLERFATAMRPQGRLMVGHAESFPAGHAAFRACGRTAYEYVGA